LAQEFLLETLNLKPTVEEVAALLQVGIVNWYKWLEKGLEVHRELISLKSEEVKNYR
jgi:hypothetical protein